MIEVLYNGRPAFRSRDSDASDYAARHFTTAPQPEVVLDRDEHRMKELSLARGDKRAPRRSQTHHNYQMPATPRTVPAAPSLIEESSSTDSSESADEAEKKTAAVAPSNKTVAAMRPALGPPRRSYSVMDYEPLPHHHRPSARMTLMDLPAELHYAIFDWLDPIDSTCFGLTSKHFWAVHRRLHPGRMPLTLRRDGPNELEWAWHLAGYAAGGTDEDTKDRALSRLRVRGQAYCRKCGVTRCELHKHIQGWMGDGYEYCSVKQKFGPVAPEGAKAYCYMSKPDDPHRCGRHRYRKSKVILQ